MSYIRYIWLYSAPTPRVTFGCKKTQDGDIHVDFFKTSTWLLNSWRLVNISLLTASIRL